MTAAQRRLDVLLDSWDRNNTVLLNLLRAIPSGGLDARAMEGTRTFLQVQGRAAALKFSPTG